MIFQKAEIHLGDSHHPPHDIRTEIVAQSKFGAISQYHELQENILIASTTLALTTQSWQHNDKKIDEVTNMLQLL